MSGKKGNDDNETDVTVDVDEMPALEDICDDEEDDEENGEGIVVSDDEAEATEDPVDDIDELAALTESERETLLADTAIVRATVTKVS